MVEQLPHGMRAPVVVTYVRCALCGVLGVLVLNGGGRAQTVRRTGVHVRETQPGVNIPEALQLVLLNQVNGS
ncbi:hypothetical protein [Streptomyces sp. NPDC058701]|uniref:hypothetical protein n=1 Tax=Streptomyces sp. NPDC058701 TaxID=3346608 RepID=UPI0036467A7A